MYVQFGTLVIFFFFLVWIVFARQNVADKFHVPYLSESNKSRLE